MWVDLKLVFFIVLMILICCVGFMLFWLVWYSIFMKNIFSLIYFRWLIRVIWKCGLVFGFLGSMKIGWFFCGWSLKFG